MWETGLKPPQNNRQNYTSVTNFYRLATGWTVKGSNASGGEVFRTCPDLTWGPPSLLYNGHRVFPEGKERPGRDADPSPLLVLWSRKSRAISLLPLWVVEWKRNVMAHAQKPDSVFQRNGRVHLYRRGCQFSRVLAFLECGSVENDCSNTGWTVSSQSEDCLATHSIRLFPLHFSSRASPCATRFRFHSTTGPFGKTRTRHTDTT